MKKVLYLNQVTIAGLKPLKVTTKYEYRMTSVTLHAMSILEYAADLATKGKLLTIGQTRSSRLATCIRVVAMGARTIPILAQHQSWSINHTYTVFIWQIKDEPVAECTTSNSAIVCVHFVKWPTAGYTLPKPTRGTSRSTRPSTIVHARAEKKL
jgi:hypothetical protein